MVRPKGSKNKKGLSRISIPCSSCGLIKEVQPWESKDRKYCSRICFAKGQSENMVGNKNFKGLKGKEHPNWKGGKTSVSKKLRSSKRWKLWRVTVFERDRFCCRLCGGKGFLHPHHIIPVKECISTNRIDLVFSKENGITWCKDCHLAYHFPNYKKRGG